ncbi:Os03g0369250, partial [Oryza sativa Japonica Group]
MSNDTLLLLRKKEASRAAKATMSAQETTPGHAASTAVLAASMTSKPRRLGLLGGASFSGCGLAGVGSSSTDASHPCTPVVEEHADEAGADAGVAEDGGADGAPDDGLGVRALVVVV